MDYGNIKSNKQLKEALNRYISKNGPLLRRWEQLKPGELEQIEKAEQDEPTVKREKGNIRITESGYIYQQDPKSPFIEVFNITMARRIYFEINKDCQSEIPTDPVKLIAMCTRPIPIMPPRAERAHEAFHRALDHASSNGRILDGNQPYEVFNYCRKYLSFNYDFPQTYIVWKRSLKLYDKIQEKIRLFESKT